MPVEERTLRLRLMLHCHCCHSTLAKLCPAHFNIAHSGALHSDLHTSCIT